MSLLSSTESLRKSGWAPVLFEAASWWFMVFGALLVPFFLWSLLGNALSAVPAGIQVACATLIGLAVALAVLMIRERSRALGAMEAFQTIFKGVGTMSLNERTSGLSPAKLSDIRRRAA